MAKIRILIVEDELIIADDIQNQLVKLGYTATGIAMTYQQGIDLLVKELPDLVLIDIKLKGTLDGIDLAQTIKETYNLPVIFLTSFADRKTVSRAKKVKPQGYLVKPFKRSDLYTSIEIALSNYIMNTPENESASAFNEGSQVIKDSIFVKKDLLLVKVRFDELQWIKAERNYLELHCYEKMILTRSTLKDLMNKLPDRQFIQVHKSYAVNCQFINALEFNKISIGNTGIPVGRLYFPQIKQKLNIQE